MIKKIREIQQIANAEDQELLKLKVASDKIEKNMFVNTATETGLMRFEKLLGITPKATQNIEERRMQIIFAMNRRKMSLNELSEMLSGYSEGIELIKDISSGELVVAICADSGDLDIIKNTLEGILPLNIYYYFALRVAKAKWNVRYHTQLAYKSEFYPRTNIPQLRFDGDAKWNGNYAFGGYKTDKRLDYYPARLGLNQTIKIRIGAESITNILQKISITRPEIQPTLCVRGSELVKTMQQSRAKIRCDTHIDAKTKSVLRVEKNLNYFDGANRWDGSQTFSASITEYCL